MPTKVVFAPINTGFAKDGIPDERLVAFHDARSGSAIGASVVGNVAVGPDFVTNPRTAVLSAASTLTPFAQIATTIRTNGSCPGIQLAACPPWLSPNRAWTNRGSSSAEEVSRLSQLLLAEKEQRLSLLLKQFLESAQLAYNAGFEIIEFHAAHGYYLSLLLDNQINRRKDGFAPNGRWLPDWLGSVRSKIPDATIIFRLSLHTGFRPNDQDTEECTQNAIRLGKYGANAVNLSCGYYTISRNLIYPKSASAASDHEIVRNLSIRSSTPVIGSGGVTPEMLRKLSPPTVLFGIGRPLLADPDFASKVRDNEDSRIQHCARSGKCHFFTRGRPHIECGTNSKLGRTGH